MIYQCEFKENVKFIYDLGLNFKILNQASQIKDPRSVIFMVNELYHFTHNSFAILNTKGTKTFMSTHCFNQHFMSYDFSQKINFNKILSVSCTVYKKKWDNKTKSKFRIKPWFTFVLEQGYPLSLSLTHVTVH